MRIEDVDRLEHAPPGRPDPSSGRPALLFLCQVLPYPPDSGAKIRSFNVMRLLARDFDVTALCFYRRESRPTEQAVAASAQRIRAFARVEVFPIPQEQNRARLLWDHFRSVLLRRVYTTYVYRSRAYRARLRQLLADRHFDLVHVDSLDLATYLPALGHLTVVCTHHNIESDLLRRRSVGHASALLGWYMRMQAGMAEREERTWCGRVALNVVVSPEDAARVKELAPSATVVVHPNGVDTGEFRPGDGDGSGLVFVGGYDWYPNREAMAYFAEQILPLLHGIQPGVSVTWIGRAPAAAREAYARQGIELTGYLEDIRPRVQGAACYVVPLRAGGGTRLKILDAWAMGKAVVSTSVGCEGLDARDGENILIRNTPESFAAAVQEVLGDVALRRRLGWQARRTAERTYNWDVIAERLLRDYGNLLGRVSPSAAQLGEDPPVGPHAASVEQEHDGSVGRGADRDLDRQSDH